MEFALKLYNALRLESSGNMFYSPLSITSVMSMVALGANGTTLDELLAVLGSSNQQGNLHEGNQGIMKQLAKLKLDGQVALEIGNKLCPDNAFVLQQEFVDMCLKYYESQVENMDFCGNSENCRLAINDWVEKATQGKIKDLLPNGSIRPDTSLVLANAIYFRGDWESKFDVRGTMQKDFHVEDGKTVKVDMMTQTRKYNIAFDQKLQLQVVEVPYAGKEVVLLLLVPTKRFGLAEIEKSLTPDLLETLTNNFSSEEIQLSLPKMKLEHQIMGLDKHLQGMGVNRVFDPSQADLSKMSSKPGLHVSKLVHKAVFEVTEEGCEAAAATAAVVTFSMALPPIMVTCDHPFMFMLKHKPSQTVLFVGRFSNV